MDEWPWWVVAMIYAVKDTKDGIKVIRSLLERDPSLKRPVALRYRYRLNDDSTDNVANAGTRSLLHHLVAIAPSGFSIFEKLLAMSYPVLLADLIAMQHMDGVHVLARRHVVQNFDRADELVLWSIMYSGSDFGTRKMLMGTYFIMRACQCLSFYADYREFIIGCTKKFTLDQTRRIANDICVYDRYFFPSSLSIDWTPSISMILDFDWDWTLQECKLMLAKLLRPFTKHPGVCDRMREKGVPVDRLIGEPVLNLDWAPHAKRCIENCEQNA